MLVEIMTFLFLEVSFFVTIIIINWQFIKKIFENAVSAITAFTVTYLLIDGCITFENFFYRIRCLCVTVDGHVRGEKRQSYWMNYLSTF